MESKLTIKTERIMICLLSKKFKNHLKEISSRQSKCSCPWVNRSIKTDELKLFGHTSIILVKKYFRDILGGSKKLFRALLMM